jgi:hypothetical protein
MFWDFSTARVGAVRKLDFSDLTGRGEDAVEAFAMYGVTAAQFDGWANAFFCASRAVFAIAFATTEVFLFAFDAGTGVAARHHVGTSDGAEGATFFSGTDSRCRGHSLESG